MPLQVAMPGAAPVAGTSWSLTGVKVVHTAIWMTVETCMLYSIYAGLRGESGRRAAIAGGVVAAETAIFLGNGAHCPLTELAESLGAGNGSVTDIFLPDRLARNLPAIHVPMVLLALYLHGRNLRRHAPTQPISLVSPSTMS
jgi:hypothetical protein